MLDPNSTEPRLVCAYCGYKQGEAEEHMGGEHGVQVEEALDWHTLTLPAGGAIVCSEDCEIDYKKERGIPLWR